MKFLSAFARADTALDLGAVNSRVFVPDLGVQVNTPSVVMVSRRNGRVLAVGDDALHGYEMGWRDAELVRPLWNGVVSEYEPAVALVRWLLNAAHGRAFRFKPCVAVAVPSGAAQMDRRVMEEVVAEAGARKVVLVDQSLAAGLGHHSDDAGIAARMVANLGGHTTEMAIVAKGRVWAQRTFPVGGQRFDQAIVAWALREYQLVLSEQTAEAVKVRAEALAVEAGKYAPFDICGQDVATGRPTIYTVAAAEVTAATERVTDQITEALIDLRDSCKPDLISQLMVHGLTLSGGGALLPGLPARLCRKLNLPVQVNDDPEDTVLVGTARYLYGPWTKTPRKLPKPLTEMVAAPTPAGE
ncbi:rod shape-determining protein [Actinomadura kijaniata]|uniref:rod shape-determining protein n=1 Tax=Actinomadura kijaniata TaxID=46161 RepID=UPI003F1D7414